MKAAVLEAQGDEYRIEIQEVDEPRPTESQVLVKVLACGVCGHDQADRVGLTRIDVPAILGHEIAGEVVAVGADVKALAVGDLVAAKQFTTCGKCDVCRAGQELDCSDRYFNYGGSAEYMALEERTLLRIPDGVDPVVASVVACAVGTCYQALFTVGEVQPGEKVLVTGAGGGLGLHGMQVARAAGAEVIALTSSESKREALLASGADAVVVTGADGEGDVAGELLQLTGGRGVDLVLDNIGEPSVFSQAFRALRKRGRYVFTGQVEHKKISVYPFFIFGKQAVITGSSSTLMSTFAASMDLVASGKVAPVIERYALGDVVAACRAMDERRVVGRAVLIP